MKPPSAAAQRGKGAFASKSTRTPLKQLRKGTNLSRQKLLRLQREALMVKRQKTEVQKSAQKREVTKRVLAAQNKKIHKTFDQGILQSVQGGLVESIESLGEPVTPLSLFMAASTALSLSPEKHHVPYILAILSACAPRLSQGMLLHQLEPSIATVERVIAENIASNYLAVAKAMKFSQQLVLSVESPSMKVLNVFSRLEPSKMQVDIMKMYLVAFRKLLERSAAHSPTDESIGGTRNNVSEGGVYILSDNQNFFVQGVRHFAALCVSNFTDAPLSVVSSTTAEFTVLIRRTISPYIVESAEGREMIDEIVSNRLLELLKPHCQVYWSYALEILEALFNRINYLKRTAAGDAMLLTRRFPSFHFLLRVLNKMRRMDDGKLNGAIERAMVALGRGMTVREFVDIIPFDPRQVYEAELRGTAIGGAYPSPDDDPWINSYVMGVLRRTASHDSLPFFVEYFFPLIQFTSGVALEYGRQQQVELAAKWTALLQQYWRLAIGFCQYPRIVDKDSFRDVAKQLVGLLPHPLFADAGATALHMLCSGYYDLASTEPVDDDDDINDGVGEAEEQEKGWLADEQQEEDSSNRVRAKVGLGHKNSLDEDDLFLSLNDPTWNRHVYHGISQTTAKDVCGNVFSRFSANIMPKLCNTFETHNSTSILRAIHSFSRVCSREVMQVILKGILDVGANIAHKQQLLQEKAEERGDKVVKKAGYAPLTGKRRMILDIACAVVEQLEKEHLVKLFDDIIEPVLMDPAPESRLLQKKAYKLLYSMFEFRSKDIFPLFTRISGILSVGRQNVTISGIKMRLRCIVWALDACKMFYPDHVTTMIRAIVGETITLSRERSSEVRTLSMDLLEKMHRYLIGAGNPVNTLLHLVLAGFSGKTTWMISSTLVAMAKIVSVAHEELPEKDLDAAVALGIRMMESTALDVRSAAAMFVRMLLKMMKRSRRVGAAVEKSISKLMLAIALTTSQPRVSSNTRLQMRVILEKCIKRFGYERLEPTFPIGSKNFLRYTQKMMKREQKKEERELRKRTEERKNEFDRLFLGAGMKAGTEDDAERDLLQAGGLTSFVSAYASPSFNAGSAGRGYNGDEDDDELDNMHIEFQEGKLHIMTAEEKRKQDDRRRREEMAKKLLRSRNGLVHADALNEGAVAQRGKRTRNDVEDFENDELLLRYGDKINNEGAAAAARRVVGPGVNQVERLREQKQEKRELKRARVEADIIRGDEFKGTGEGDVRRGGLAPYAYVPLNRQYMNRRHQREAIQRLEVVAQRSNLKGNKAKLSKLAKQRRAEKKQKVNLSQ
ncbi:hypothetical protein, conserved [Trypanosoma brucei brucei TREU927]|uniref:RRP12 HEAT domain-containing protein n=1 Tax=Trypanosoma brucei brucei (strain 927/4 GUTat10.1) TaxID=185431 RepID=Q386Q9_TRYB2|nr:hypothetical protein, conserved [Trypanosoma brucei brucei TREU927]EAN79222.1 hypothetical protein, conserved [Trypanosoma brucei brucei TREU927]